MRLTSLADYAVVLMTAAARHCGHAAVKGAGNGAGLRSNARALSDETGIPLPTAQKLVSKLSAAGLIESVRGAGGGFRLARPPAAISMADIIEAVEGPLAISACADDTRHDCALETACQVKPHMLHINTAVRGALGGVTLASLTQVI